MINVSVPKAKSEDIVVQETGDETLVYDLKTSRAYCLNKTSTLVWKLCDGKRTFAEISDEMSKKTKELISEDFVVLAVKQLSKDGLVEVSSEIQNQLNNLSRRNLIKKIGYGSLVALPIVSGIVAPQAVSAQSCLGTNVACTMNGECCGSNCISGSRVGMFCCDSAATDNLPSGFEICTTGTPGSCPAVQSRCCSNSVVDSGISGPGGSCFDPTDRICTCN